MAQEVLLVLFLAALDIETSQFVCNRQQFPGDIIFLSTSTEAREEKFKFSVDIHVKKKG